MMIIKTSCSDFKLFFLERIRHGFVVFVGVGVRVGVGGEVNVIS